MSTPELARAAAVGGHEAFGAIRDLPFPTLAAINGAAVGGGLEIALHCDYRTVARSVRHIGFPEVFLGIIPGWGGTQLTPRLVGAAAAVELIVANPLKQNRFIDAPRAAELGLADALLDDVEFLDDSIEWLVRAIETAARRRGSRSICPMRPRSARRPGTPSTTPCTASRSRPYRALELIAGSAEWSIAEGYAAEEDALADLLPGPQAQAGVYAFDLDRATDQEGHRHPRREAAPDRSGRRRRRRPDGDTARDAVPPPARGARRDHGHRRRPGRGGRRGGPRGSREAGVARPARRGQGAVSRLDRQRGNGHRGLRRLRPRDRGRVRGDRRQAGGVRRARGGRRRRVPARHEHVVAVGLRDGARTSGTRSGSSACTSSTRSRCSRSSSSCARPRPTTRRSRRRGT